MVRYGLTLILLFIGFVAFAQFPRFRLIQLEQSATQGQIIKSDTANNAIWSSDLRLQDSIFYIFGNPYVVDSTRLNTTKDTLFYYQFDSIVGFTIIDGDETNEIQTLSISNDTIYLTSGGFVVLPGGFVNTDESGRNNAFLLVDSTITITDDSSTLSLDVREFYDNTDTSGYNITFEVIDDTLYLVDGLGTKSVALLQYLDNTDNSGYNSSIYISNDTLYVEDDNSLLSVKLPIVDTSGFNKRFQIINDTLFIEDSDTTLFVDILDYKDNTDTSGFNRQFYISNDTIFIIDDNSTLSLALPPLPSSTFEYNKEFYLQDSIIYIRDDSATLSVDLKALYDNTDIQQLSKNGDTIFLDNSPYVTLLDDDPTNELQTLTLSNDSIFLSNGGFIKLPPSTDDQELSITRDGSLLTITIENGNSITFTDLIDDADNDVTNEIQILSIANDTIFLTSSGFIVLPPDIDTDEQTLSINRVNDSLFIDISNGNQIAFEDRVDDADNDITNELQDLSLDNNFLKLSNSTDSVDLSVYLDDTDAQNLSVLRNDDSISISIERGNTIIFEDKVFDGDSSITNELQLLSFSGDTLYLSNGNEVYLGNYINTDTSGFNRSVSYVNDTLYITDDNGTLEVYIASEVSQDIQQLSLSNDTLYLQRGGFVVLEDLDATNELQDLYLSENKDTLYITNGSGIRLNIDSTRLNSRGDSLIYYFNDSIVRVDALATVLEVISGCVPGLTESTDVYALFDMSGSVDTNNVITIINVLNSWYSAYQAANPAYTGNLYTIPVQGALATEAYLDYLRILRTDELNVYTSLQSINNIVTLPPWLDGSNGEFVAPTEMLLLAFVNESHDSYHYALDSFLTYEPSLTYQQHLQDFEIHYDSMSFFKGVLYPMYEGGGYDTWFLLHALAATEGTTLTLEQIQDALGTNYFSAFDILTTDNPYSVLTPLKDYNWSYVLDKYSPASETFTDSSFNAEISEILEVFDLNYVSVIQDYSNNILTLRSIGSSTLDVTVDSTGCIRVELKDSVVSQIYTDTSTIVGDGTIVSPIQIAPALIDSIRQALDTIPFLPQYTDSTRLSPTGDTLLYYQNEVLIGFGVINKGGGLFQELFTGTGTTNNIQLAAYDGLLPTDKSDILIYRNGLFIDEAYITALDPTTGVIQLSFTPELDDRIMIVWMVGEVTVLASSGEGGLDSVFTTMRLTGNGTLLSPLDIDTMYVASKAYVDQSLGDAGLGDITGVNGIPQYGILGGSESGEVSLSVDTSVIAAKDWVTNQGYLLSNDSITIQGDVSTVKGDTLFNLTVNVASNIRGGAVGDLLYQSTSNTTAKLTLPPIEDVGTKVLVNGLTAPYWESLSNTTSGSTIKLDTARNINGISFDGTSNINVALNYSLSPGSFIIGNSFDGSANQTWSINALSTNSPNTIVSRDANGNFIADTITARFNGIANSVQNSLIAGNYLTGSNYNGSTELTWNVDTTKVATKFYVDSVASTLGVGNITSVTNGYGLLKSQTEGDVTLTVDTLNAIASKVFVSDNYVPLSRSITINGTTQDLSANRTFTIPTHNAVTLGTANGLSLNNQQLSLAAASSTSTGALAAADWVTFNNKANANGSNATGIWGIDITGNAGTVTNGVYSNQFYNNPSWINTLAWSKISSTPTTISGYGITDTYTKTEVNTFLSGKQDASAKLSSLASLTYTTGGFVKMVGTNTFQLDNSTYLTANQTITLSGDISGSGTTSISTALSNTGVVASTYKSVTVDAKGRVTAGTNPTTLSGYGITDALSTSTTSTQDGYFGDIYLRDDITPSHYLILTSNENLTANRTLSLSLNNANRVLTLQGNLTVSDLANVSGTNTGDQTITLTGDVTGSGTGSFATALSTTGVTQGTYSYPTLTVDTKGRITSISTNAINVDSDSLNSPLKIVQRNSLGGFSAGEINATSLKVGNYTGQIGNQSNTVFYNGAINLVDNDVSSLTAHPFINVVENSLINDANTTTESSASELYLTVADPDMFNTINFIPRNSPIITMKGLNYTRLTNEKGLIKILSGGNSNSPSTLGHDGAIILSTSELDRLAINSQGRVGIGTISNSSTSLTSEITHLLQLKNGNTADNYFRIFAGGQSFEAFNISTEGTGSTSVLTKIGIQTGNPLAAIHIGGANTKAVSGLSVSILNTATLGRGRFMFYDEADPDYKVAFGAGWSNSRRFAIFTKNTSANFDVTYERFTVIETGNVGVNVVAPVYRFEVKETNTANTRAIDDGSVQRVASFVNSSNVGIQIGNNTIYNETAYGTSNTAGNISLAFATSTSTNPTTKMVILGNGNVGINSFTPTEKLYVNGNIATTGSFIETSSIRYKSNVKSLDTSDVILKLNPVSYTVNKTGLEDIGFIAEEVYKIFPNLVILNDEGQPDGLKYVKIIPLLVKKIQEQEERLQRLEALINK